MPVILVGTLDTKGDELAFVRDLLVGAGGRDPRHRCRSLGPPAFAPDIDREEVFRRAGDLGRPVRERGDRGQAVADGRPGRRRRGGRALRRAGDRPGHPRRWAARRARTIGTAAMRRLPFGVPKVMVSTLASGQTRPYRRRAATS